MSNLSSAANVRDVSKDIFSATIGSICCCYTGQPLDTIKVRMQTNPIQYPGIVSTFTKTVKNEGVKSLWKGSVPTALGMAAENIVAFGVNEFIKRSFPDPNVFKDPNSMPDLIRPFAMGSITGFCSALVLLPSEIVKAKTQVAVGSGASSDGIIKKMLKQQGLKSMFVGLDSQLMRDVPFYAAFFGCYELNCYLFRTYVPSMPDSLNYFLSGGFAGMIGWTAVIAFDVPKTNVQSRWDTKVVGSYFPEMVAIAKQRGFLGLYSGLGATLLRAFPANAALFLGVETGRKMFDDFLWKI